MDQGIALNNAYKKASLNLRLRDIKVGYIVALILVPAGFILDFFYYKEHFSSLILIRGICFLVLLALYFLSFSSIIHKYIWVVGILWATVINIAICFMILSTEGVASTYYAGLNLAIIGASLILPLTLVESISITLITLLLYLSAITLYDHTVWNHDFKILFNNLYFIILTGVIGTVATFMREKQRFREFSLRYELDSRNQELAKLDRVKSEFFANISHELRTPLTLILSPVEDLLHSDQPFDFKVNQLLSTVRDNSYRLLKLVNDLLSIIQLDEKSTTLELKPLELSSLLRGVVQSMQHLAEKQKITLESDIGFDSSTMMGNTTALEKIFINLINNAIKFTPENGTITITCQINKEAILITIKDTGIGISKDDLPHIFERFRQIDSSATRKYQGTGLGLALVRELTTELNSSIHVESEPNKGTTILLSFPLSDKNKDTSNTQTNVTDTVSPLEEIHRRADYSLPLNKPNTATLEPLQHKGENTDSNHQRAKLLIVEDEPDLRSYLVNSLSGGYHVFSASDGTKGLELITKHKPDLVLLDLMLPGIDGLQLCKKIKQTEELQFTKVILLTARIDEQSKIKALQNGADDFLTKPFSTIEVKTRLANLWKSGQLDRRLQSHNKQLNKALNDLKAMESQLIHSEKMSAIGNLAAGLLHEVNNPLNYAITAVQILQREPDIKKSEDLTEIVDDIFEGMERIRIIVKDLRTFAYPSSDDKEQPFNLLDTVNNALRFTASEHRGVAINVSITDDIVALGSSNHIVQVLINLITNAIKAIKDNDTPEIVISAKTVTNSNSKRILVSIKDNGTGMTEDTILHIFEPFYTTRDVGDGLGMGLSICYTIIKNHGGSITVDSKLGQYTEFSFDLATHKEV